MVDRIRLSLQRLLCVLIGTFSMFVLGGCSLFSSNEYVNLADQSIENLQYDEAIDYLNTAIENGEDERLIYRSLGIALTGKGSYQEAIEAFETSLNRSEGIVNKMDLDINYYLANAYYKTGNEDEAIKIYDTILSLESNEVNAYYLRGVLYAKKENLAQAQSDFDKAISLAPTDYNMLINIYQILLEYGYKDVGTQYLQTALSSETKKMSDYEKGQICYYLEDYESAKTYLEKAVEAEGERAALFLGRTYEYLGDPNYAVSVYSAYINQQDASAEIINQMGICKMNMEDYAGALSAFQLAMKAPDCQIMQSLKFNEIVAYEYMGDFEKAETLMNSYIKLYPDDADAKREADFLKTR